MKKFIAFILACMLLFSFTACGNDNGEDDGKNPDTNVNVNENGDLEFPIAPIK